MRVAAGVVACVLALGLAAGVPAQTPAGEPTLAPSPERRTVLTHMVREDCGSCHGRTLAGGLGPALTPRALADKAPDMLAATIFFGRAGTPMPPWSPFLSQVEAQWIAASLRQGLPDERP
jgi:cytochrome c55X